jgi:ribosomal protein S12 methylthiotransferase
LAKYKIGVISLGCDKNRIDTEIMLGNLNEYYEITSDPKDAEIIVVNTCGFIETSKQESIDTILEMAKYKKQHKCRLLITTGCLSQRYGKELMDLMPEIDIMVGVNDYDKLHEVIENFMVTNEKAFICTSDDKKVNEGRRIITTAASTAYVRIGEGCSNFCTYCIIPMIRGKYRSRKMEDILEEVKLLAQSGVREVILVAQDTTKYGIDVYGEKRLPQLLRAISQVEGVDWIRVLYCYVEEITDELIEEIAANEKVCKYLDMPIQHISDNILKSMGRRGRKNEIIEIIAKLRSKIENMVLRTTLIVGFPGESDKDFEELVEFVRDVKFDKLGVFKYSPEEGTPASNMTNQIDEAVKENRERELMLLQQGISKDVNSLKTGRIYDVLVEKFDNNFYIGRNKGMAPEIDGSVLVRSERELIIGSIVKVKITDAMEYDLIGDVYYESC